MKARTIILFVVMFILLAACFYVVDPGWFSSSGNRTARDASDYPMAPNFELTSLDGNLINLNHYRGKVVLLNFWATWCGPCKMEIPGLENLQAKYGLKGFRVIGMDMISEDNANDVRNFYRRFRMNYPVVLASDEIGNLYGGIQGTPTSFLIGCDGRIHAEYVGLTSENVLARQIHGLLAACPNG